MKRLIKYRLCILIIGLSLLCSVTVCAIHDTVSYIRFNEQTTVYTDTTISSTTETTTEIETTTEAQTTVEVQKTVEETTCTPAEDENLNAYDLYYMAHLLYAEAGSSWCSDELQLYVGSVVLNRVESDQFPNTIRDVIYRDGQYACTWDGNFEKEPDARAWKNAEIVLVHGSQLPDNVVYQAEFEQGSGVHCQVGNTYFCYL